MNLQQARTWLERVNNTRISNTELAKALNMKLPNISKKLKAESKLRTSQIEALEKYFCLKLPANIEDYLQEANNNYNQLEDVIDKVLTFLSNHDLPIPLTNKKRAKLITTIYRMVQYNATEVNDTLIENLLRLMNE